MYVCCCVCECVYVRAHMCMCLYRVGFCRNREELYHYVGMGPAPESVRLGSFEKTKQNKNQPAIPGHGLVGEELSQAPNFTFPSLFGTKCRASSMGCLSTPVLHSSHDSVHDESNLNGLVCLAF